MAFENMNMLDAIKHTLDYALENIPKVILFGEDVEDLGGVFRVLKDLYGKHGKSKIFNTPISESSIVGSGIGLALAGFRPIAEIQFEGFIFPALQDLFCHAVRLRNRTRGKLTVPMVVRTTIQGNIKALEHHSESIEGMLASFPGLHVVVPSNPIDAKGLLLSAIKCNDPVIFLEPKILYRGPKEEVPLEPYEIEIGKARVVQEGSDVTVVGWSSAIPVIQTAIESLKKDNIFVELIDLRSITPIDQETIIQSVKKTGRLVVTHEATKTYGPAGEIITLVNEYAFDALKSAPMRITGHDIITPLGRGEYHQVLNPAKIIYYIKKMFNKL
ncbi:MAG: alpha-ketoacid dehydrogenase subunit beta ['Bonamia sp.' little leaf phytoplasma]|nr:alpha-ketoacid dehydrogenase subunit beta ['Bonamia sp.' little leaf phytoplasma]